MQCEHRLLSMIKQPSLAVIVPFFNEEEAVGKVCGELRSVLDLRLPDTDVILLDDGSGDRTGERLNRIAATWPQCRVFRLEQNRGQSAALLFGFGKAEAPILATMDGDGQNDPNDLVRLLGRMDEADMVVGKRMDRQDFWTRRTVSRVANLVRSRWLGDGVSDAGCALKVFRREVVEAFIPILYPTPSCQLWRWRRVIEWLRSRCIIGGERLGPRSIPRAAFCFGQSSISLGWLGFAYGAVTFAIIADPLTFSASEVWETSFIIAACTAG